ncbi:hypothetical protein E7T06_18425 [Deinococcus sp. Arct2-2]|uniref:hypothetical protein n=1 Tax=Deinococcus sp. Arct2-2 TaxID=2568653 RepID=UPI0010A48537|nr:hypothetical protein [Deinococcus sp. Arct2-2]THF68016.1 hypothetical protein E7T06_18425 [Deinococcus sp. Arct2-2]
MAPGQQATVEHFIPKWLLRQVGLHVPKKGNHLLLPNNVPIRGPVTVPCCQRCNGRLSLLERPVRRIFENPGLLSADDRSVMFLWLLKVAYGSAHVDFRNRMSNRGHIRFGSVISRTSFNRMRMFHGRVLREYCLTGTIRHLQLDNYSLMQAAIEDQGPYFSKSVVRNRVTVAWRGQVFRLTIDSGHEERQAQVGTAMKGQHFDAFMSSNDVFTPHPVRHPRLHKGRQKMTNITPKRLHRGHQILITLARRVAQDEFLFVGHILEAGGILPEENMVQIVVRRTYQNERMHLDEIEIHQPGLQLVATTAASGLNFREALGLNPFTPLTDEEEFRMLLFTLHSSLGVSFKINPPVGLTPDSIP